MHLNIIISMSKITLFLLVSTVCINCLRPVYGPVLSTLSAFPHQGKATQDQMIIVVTFSNFADAEVYENTGYGYQVKQQLPGTLGSTLIFVTNTGAYVFMYNRNSDLIMIFKQ